MALENDLTGIKNIVRIGTVSSVNPLERTARVKFDDKNDLVSGELKVIENTPRIIANEIELEYDNQSKRHTHEVTVTPWLPAVEQMVLCIYLPNGESDGFIIGGI